MKIFFKRTAQHPTVPFAWAGTLVEIRAVFHDDDSEVARSTNSGHSEIILTSKAVRFAFPLQIKMPHPDLIALCALKLFSPYIGSTLELQDPVSERFEKAAKLAYKNLKSINSSPDVQPRVTNSENPAISFSGGADSVAAAAVLGASTPLVQLARMDHPMIPGFENWYKTEANIKTLQAMPDSHPKYTVFSDMEFLSTNGRWCVYPDTYAFTIPVMLLADTLAVSHIITGDIWVAFTGDETISNRLLTYKRKQLFEASGLPIEYPCNGIGEIASMMIANELIGASKCTTCQYGEFEKPCMRCIKCFRKSLIFDALYGSQLVLDHMDSFNNSPAINGFAEATGRKAAQFAPTYKWCASKISYFDELKGASRRILDRSMRLKLNVSYCDSHIAGVYETDRPEFIKLARERISSRIRVMKPEEVVQFSKVNWKENGL